MIFAIIVAAGSGKRMNSDIPKQFLRIGDRTVLSLTMEVFRTYGCFERIIIASDPKWSGHIENIIRNDFDSDEVFSVVEGGRLRNDSLVNGIKHIQNEGLLDDDTIVVTHDGVRPFVTHEMIRNNLSALDSYIACETAIQATDTVFISSDGKTVDEKPDRSKMYQSQTPQSFRAKPFLEMYGSLSPEDKEKTTDAIRPFIMNGYKVGIAQGDVRNIKITYPDDLKIAAILYDTEHK